MELCLKINLCNNVEKANISRQPVTQSGCTRGRHGGDLQTRGALLARRRPFFWPSVRPSVRPSFSASSSSASFSCWPFRSVCLSAAVVSLFVERLRWGARVLQQRQWLKGAAPKLQPPLWVGFPNTEALNILE